MTPSALQQHIAVIVSPFSEEETAATFLDPFLAITDAGLLFNYNPVSFILKM